MNLTDNSSCKSQYKTLSHFACELRSQSSQLVFEVGIFFSPPVGKDHKVCLHLRVEQAHCSLQTKSRPWNTINSSNKQYHDRNFHGRSGTTVSSTCSRFIVSTWYKGHLYLELQINTAAEQCRWRSRTYHLVVFCDVSNLVDCDEVHKTIRFYLLGLGKIKLLLVPVNLYHHHHHRYHQPRLILCCRDLLL